MLRNFFSRFGKRPSTDLDTERSVCGKASPSTTPSRATLDNYKENEGRSVHQLWPLEDHVRSTNFDVVFFHGLHWPSEKEAWKSTWTQLDDPQDCWPQNWLPQDLEENVRVLSISYDACPTQSEEKGSIDDVSEISKNILETLVLSKKWRLGQQHGFVLIGHCFGGLVIKSLVEEARKRARLGNVRNAIDRESKASAEMFLKNLKGVVFYAVPHSGSENLISYFSRNNQITIPRRDVELAGFMQNVQPFQLQMENLSLTFDAIVDEFSINIYAFVEGKPMKDVGSRLVEKAAEVRSAGKNYYTLEDCDHSTVCKPPGKNHPSYYRLLDFIRICRQEERETFLGFECNWKENFQFYVEPSDLPNILLQNLMEEGSKNILVYGGFGYGKTTLVKYVLYKNAKELNSIFQGGIFHMKYGQKDNEVLSCQKELIRALQLNPQELQGLECWQIGSVRAKLEELLNGRFGPILLFIDDVWTGPMIDNSPELKRTKGSKLLVASRFNLKVNQANWFRIEINGTTNNNAAAQLLARKAANDPNETKFPLHCERIAEKLLSKCNGCFLAITIIGAILWENQAQTSEEWEHVYEKFKDYADTELAAEDYNGEGKTIFAAIKLSLEYGQEESERVGMENILRTLTLFEEINMKFPAIVVHLAWSYLQPQGEISHFKMLLNRLIARNLVVKWQYSLNAQGPWEFQEFQLPQLVQEYVSMKLEAIDMCNVLKMENQELFTGRKKKIEKNFLLATFLPICKTRHTDLEYALSLGQFYYENWRNENLFKLLGTTAENAILLASQPHKLVTQVDIEALFHLLNSDKIRAVPAACILAQLVDQQLVDQFYGVDIFQHKSIQGFIQNLKHQWKTLKDWEYSVLFIETPYTVALKLVKYRTFAEKLANDEDFMKILIDIIIHSVEFGCDSLKFLFTWCQHKSVRNIFYQNYRKICMKNILKQISSKLNQETKLFQITDHGHNVYRMLDLSLQYEDLAIQIIDEGSDDIVLGIFYNLFEYPNLRKDRYGHSDEDLLFSILDRLAKQKEGEAIIIKHIHWLLLYPFNDETKRFYILVMSEGFTKLVQHKGIAQALITEERVELLVGAWERGEVAIVPLVLERLFFENEEFACKVIRKGGWRMMIKGLQFMSSFDMPQFSLTHIAREMASKGEIQELIMEVINEDNNVYYLYCLKLLENLVTYHIDIMRDEFIGKGGIQFLLARLTSLHQWKKFEIITSCLLQKVVLDIKGAEKMMAHNGIQVLVQLLVVGLDYNVNNMYLTGIVNIIKLLVEGLEDPMKLLMSSIDDIDILKIHKALLCRPPHDGRAMSLSFLPETLDVDKNIVEELLNFSSYKPPDIIYLDKDIHDDYQYDCNTIRVFIELSKHVDIASQIMAKEGILKRFVIQLSKGNFNCYIFQLLEVVLQHEKVATQVVRQRPSFIKELLQLFPMERSTFKYQKIYSVASLLFILAKHGGVFIKFIVNSDGIKILLKEASLQNWIGRCNVIKVLGIMAKDENHALKIEKVGGSKMLLRAISCYLQYVHDTHLETVIHSSLPCAQFNKEYDADHQFMIYSKFITPYIKFNREYEDDYLVMCCLKTLSRLVHHEEIAKQISTTRGDSKECAIIALVDVMQTASQLWSSITLILHETVVTKRLMQIKGHMLTILSNVASTLVSMAKLHPHIDMSKKVNEDVLKGIFQLEGIVIDEHQALKEALQDLLDIKKFHTKTWNCQQLRSKTIDIRSYEGKLGECQAHFGIKGTSNEGQSSGTTKEDDD